MPDSIPAVHHVVFCVGRDNQDLAAAFWRDLGFEFADIDLPDVGLRVLLDWDRGVEIISPNEPANEGNEPVRRFLADRGEGVYSVVVRTGDVDGPTAVAARYGATVLMQQHRGGDAEGFELDEVTVSAIHGMEVTFLATDM